MTAPVVLKLGGSLLTIPDVMDRLEAVISRLRPSPVLIVPGGGAAADVIRDLDPNGNYPRITLTATLLPRCRTTPPCSAGSTNPCDWSGSDDDALHAGLRVTRPFLMSIHSCSTNPQQHRRFSASVVGHHQRFHRRLDCSTMARRPYNLQKPDAPETNLTALCQATGNDRPGFRNERRARSYRVAESEIVVYLLCVDRQIVAQFLVAANFRANNSGTRMSVSIRSITAKTIDYRTSSI